MHLKKLRVILWFTVAVALTSLVGLKVFIPDNKETPVQTTKGVASLQADFELTDHLGKIRTDESFDDKWMLVFFGFTNCPDICPVGLSTIAQTLDDLGPASTQIQSLFITVDPQRDTPSVLADYIPQFHPDILGLSGTAKQIDRTAKSFKIFYGKVKEATAPDGYTMEHSSSIFLFDPNGEFVRLYDFNATSDEILTDLKSRMDI